MTGVAYRNVKFIRRDKSVFRILKLPPEPVTHYPQLQRIFRELDIINLSYGAGRNQNQKNNGVPPVDDSSSAGGSSGAASSRQNE